MDRSGDIRSTTRIFQVYSNCNISIRGAFWHSKYSDRLKGTIQVAQHLRMPPGPRECTSKALECIWNTHILRQLVLFEQQSKCIWSGFKISGLYLNRILNVCIIFQLLSISILYYMCLECTRIILGMFEPGTNNSNEIIQQICAVLSSRQNGNRIQYNLHSVWFSLSPVN